MSIIKRTLRTTKADLILVAIIDEQDWRVPIIQKLAPPYWTTIASDLKDFTIAINELYY